MRLGHLTQGQSQRGWLCGGGRQLSPKSSSSFPACSCLTALGPPGFEVCEKGQGCSWCCPQPVTPYGCGKSTKLGLGLIYYFLKPKQPQSKTLTAPLTRQGGSGASFPSPVPSAQNQGVQSQECWSLKGWRALREAGSSLGRQQLVRD